MPGNWGALLPKQQGILKTTTKREEIQRWFSQPCAVITSLLFPRSSEKAPMVTFSGAYWTYCLPGMTGVTSIQL